MSNRTIFENQTNRDNGSLLIKAEATICLDTTKSSEVRHHNFTSSRTLAIEENAEIKISLYLKSLQALSDKCQFTLVLYFLNSNRDKRIEKKNVIFSVGTLEYYDIYFQSQSDEKEVLIGLYINKVMKFKISLQQFSLKSNSKSLTYTEKEIHELLEHNPVVYINELCEAWHTDEAIDIIKQLWQKRDKSIINVFFNSHEITHSLGVKIWLNIFIHMRNGTVPKKKLIIFILGKLYLFNTSKHKKELENNILNLLIKINDLNFLEESFEKFKTLTYESLHIFYKLGILRLALNNSTKDYLRVKNKFTHFSDIEKLKLYELDFRANIVPKMDNTILVKRLKEAVISNIPDEDFYPNIYEPFKKILTRNNSTKLNFLDCRTSKSELSYIYALIEKAILTKSPFSFIRLGDAESYMLNATNNPLSIVESEDFENALWGKTLTLHKRFEVANSCLATFNDANVVGVFSVHRFIRDIHSNTISLNNLWKLTRLIKFISNNLNDQIIVEDRIHHFLFDVSTIKKFIGISKKVIFITSIHSEKIIEVFDNVVPIEIIQTPSEAHMFTNKDYANKNKNILPDVTQDICSQLSKSIISGTLVLVASGLAGKLFLKTAKSHGAVALDIGCMADYYIGNKTRSIVELV